MKKEYIIIIVIVVVVIVIALIAGGYIFYKRDHDEKYNKGCGACGSNIEEFKHESSYESDARVRDATFPIKNFLKVPAIVVVGDTTIAVIPPYGRIDVPMSEIDRRFKQGFLIKVYTLNDKNEKSLYSSSLLATPKGTMINELNIGMITSRWVGADSDYNIGKPGLNAVQGLPWIKIHNLTDQYLSLNENINISPNGILRYTGRDHFGVRLGTVFKDMSGTHPDFIFTVPATDVYYGVVSDVEQTLFGGFQLTPTFVHGGYEPQFLLEEGYLSGPADGNIPIGFLPIEGKTIQSVDRWGQIPTEFNMEYPVGPPVGL